MNVFSMKPGHFYEMNYYGEDFTLFIKIDDHT